MGLAVIQVEMQVRGVNGQVTLLSDRIQIKRAGAMARLTQARNGGKDILLSDLSGVRIQLPNLLSNGYIRFFLINGEAADSTLIRAASDADTVLFNGRQLSRFVLLKTEIEKKIAVSQPAAMLLLPAPAIAEPVITEPVVAEPVVAEPVVTEPVVVEPVVVEPVVVEPVVTEPVVTEPVVTEPVVTEIVITESVIPDSAIAESTTAEPLIASPPIAAPVITARVLPAGLPPIDFDQLGLIAEQYKQGLISRAEWVATKRKLLGL